MEKVIAVSMVSHKNMIAVFPLLLVIIHNVSNEIIRSPSRKEATFSLQFKDKIPTEEAYRVKKNVFSVIACSNVCLKDSQCVAYNYGTDVATCELVNAYANSLFVYRPGWNHYAIHSKQKYYPITDKSETHCFVPEHESCHVGMTTGIKLATGKGCLKSYAYFSLDESREVIIHYCSGMEVCPNQLNGEMHFEETCPKNEVKHGWRYNRVLGLMFELKCVNTENGTIEADKMITIQQNCTKSIRNGYRIGGFHTNSAIKANFVYTYSGKEWSVEKLHLNGELGGIVSEGTWDEPCDIQMQIEIDQVKYLYAHNTETKHWFMREIFAGGIVSPKGTEGTLEQPMHLQSFYQRQNKSYIFGSNELTQKWTIRELKSGGYFGPIMSTVQSEGLQVAIFLKTGNDTYLYGNIYENQDITFIDFIKPFSGGEWVGQPKFYGRLYDKYTSQFIYQINGTFYLYGHSSSTSSWFIAKIIRELKIQIVSQGVKQNQHLSQFPLKFTDKQYFYRFNKALNRWYIQELLFNGTMGEVFASGDREKPHNFHFQI